MYAIRILSSLNKSFSTKVRRAVLSLKHIRQFSYKPKHPSSYDIKSQVAKDVVLFRLENPKFFLCINIFSLGQCVFWMYLGAFLVKVLKNPNLTLNTEQFWDAVLEKERKYATPLSAVCVILGCVVCIGTALYSFRSIRKVILHRGGSNVTLVTYGLPGYNTLKVPLHNIGAMEHRSKAKKYIPIKVKNTYFYYLIDVNGEFSNAELFDFTVGMKRTLQ